MNAKPIFLVVAGLITVAVGVYVMLNTSGNTPSEVVLGQADNAVGANCALSQERGKSLDSSAVGQVAAFRPLDEPLDLTEINFKDENGNAKTLADWNNQFVLFNLWATWCPPCREEMPWFEELQVKKGGDDFQVVPVSIDLGDPAKPRQFYEETGLEALPFLHDSTMEAFQSLKKKAVALGMPTTLLVDTNGCGLGVLNGPAHWASQDAINLIDATIALAEIN